MTSPLAPLVLKEVTNKKDLKKFIQFKYDLYKGNKYNCPPLFFDEIDTLDPKRNPASEHCTSKLWMAFRGKKVVGRIAAIINKKFFEIWGEKKGRFGWVDFVDDYEVSQRLFDIASKWLKSNGMTKIHGPLGFCDFDYEGMLVEGFDELSTFISLYNYPYYISHLDKFGFVKEVDWVEYELRSKVEPKIWKFPDVEHMEDIIKKRYGFSSAIIKSKKDLFKYGEEVFELFNECYSHLHAFVPLTKKQINYYLYKFFDFVNINYIPIILDKNGKIAGVLIGMPDITKGLQKANGKFFPFGFLHILKDLFFHDTLDFVLMAIKPNYVGKGINLLLFLDIAKYLNKKKRVIKLESSFILESNLSMNNIVNPKLFNYRQHKRRRCFIKDL